MSRLQSNRRPDGPGTAGWIAIGGLCVVGTIGAIALGAWQIGVATSDDQTTGWTDTASVVLLIGAVIVLVLASLIAWAASRGQKGRTRVDDAAKYLGNRNKADLAPLTKESAAKQAERLHASAAGPGVPLGEPVSPR